MSEYPSEMQLMPGDYGVTISLRQYDQGVEISQDKYFWEYSRDIELSWSEALRLCLWLDDWLPEIIEKSKREAGGDE